MCTNLGTRTDTPHLFLSFWIIWQRLKHLDLGSKNTHTHHPHSADGGSLNPEHASWRTEPRTPSGTGTGWWAALRPGPTGDVKPLRRINPPSHALAVQGMDWQHRSIKGHGSIG